MNILKKVFFIMSVLLCLSGCGKTDIQKKDLQGVSVTEQGKVAVTFTVPEGKDVEDVLGCEIGKENIAFVSSLENSSQEYNIYWYEVANGGILSRLDNVYRYAPEATLSMTTGVLAPPGWAMLYSVPSEEDVFRQEDTKILSEKYGINLYFD